MNWALPAASTRDKVNSMMNLTINGELRQMPAPLTLTDLIDAMGYTGKRIAIEQNGAIIPKSRLAHTPVNDGDRFEIVVAVGGG